MKCIPKFITNVFISLFALAFPAQAIATVVQTVDEPVTTKAGTWTHQVDEAGDYQIGMAWIEVKPKGRVDLRILASDKEIKSLTANPGPAPLRFETRVEDLSQGDTIEIMAIPVRGTRYRIGYQVAFCTPTFDGVKVFHVADYGAQGNGKTDDMAAITRAVAAAKNAGGGIVRFDGSNTYRVIGRADLTVEPVFDLNGARNIKIEGNGATLMIHPPDRMAHVAFAENIHIDGFTVDYDPKPYYQGTITDIDVSNLMIDIDVPQRYPVPEVGIAPTHAPFFGRSFISDAPGARSGRGENIYVASTSRHGGERQIRIQVPEKANGASMARRVKYAYDNNATEFVVPHRVYGHLGGNNIITRSSRIKLSNIRYHCAPYFWMNILSNTGPVTLSNVDIRTPHPETELYVTWRDGLHIKNGRWGILIEDGDWDGAAMYDDTFALYSRRQVLVSTTGNVVTLTPSFQARETFLWQPGDWASFWSPDQGILRGMAHVVSAKDVAAPHYAVTLESVPADVTEGDVVLHEESLNRNTVIRNCTTTRVGTESSTTRFRGTDVLFQNNHFEEFDFRLEFNDRLGTPRARDVVIEDTHISSVEGRVTLSRPLGVVFKGCTLDGVDVLCRHGAENVYFDDVAWTNMNGNILKLIDGSRAWLFGSSSRNSSTSGLSDWIDRDASSAIQYKVPRNYPPLEPPATTFDSVRLSPNADAYAQVTRSEEEAQANDARASAGSQPVSYVDGFPPPVPNPKVKTKIELVENDEGLLVRSENSYQEARDNVARYLENTYLKKLREYYPKQKDVMVKVAKRPSDESLLIHENLIYARWGKRAMVLDLYAQVQHTDPLPVVVWVHGGGWQWGSHHSYRAAAMKLAKRGFATACVEYRLAGEATFPAAIYDVKAAVRWLRANAAKYDLDSRRIGITGGSAGGNIAVLTAVTFGDKRFEGPANHLDQSSEIQCVVSLYGAMSWTARQWAGSHQPPELHRETTPDFHIMNGAPLPPILFLNEWDRRADRRWGADTMQWIKENKKDHPAELKLFNAPHAFIHFEPHQDQAVDILADFFRKHLPEIKSK